MARSLHQIKARPFEIAGFSDLQFLAPKPNAPVGTPTKAVLFAMNIENEKIGYAWLPEQEYLKDPIEGMARIKKVLYDTFSWLREGNVSKLPITQAEPAS